MPHAYQELRSYSALTDCTVVRVSVGDNRGKEYFMLLTDNGTRKEWRQARTAALEAIDDAMEGGCDPGEVVVSPDAWEELMERAGGVS